MLDSGPYTISSYLHTPFFSMLQLLIWTFEELAAVTACCLCIFKFFLSIMVLEKAARGSESVLGYRNEPSITSKNTQMKGYKIKVIIDKKHSNNDLTIQMWRLSTKNGLET